MESKIQESTFLAEGRAYIVYIRFELDPYDWYELKASDAWKEVERMVEDFGSRDNLIRRLEALDLKERASSEQVLSSLPPASPEASDTTLQTALESKELLHRPIWQRWKK